MSRSRIWRRRNRRRPTSRPTLVKAWPRSHQQPTHPLLRRTLCSVAQGPLTHPHPRPRPQALSIVDAKVRQVVLHVDRHMQMVSADVEERLRMYEATIIRVGVCVWGGGGCAGQTAQARRTGRSHSCRRAVRTSVLQHRSNPGGPPRPELCCSSST